MMRLDRVVVVVTAACIVALTLATGPVGLLDIGESTGPLDGLVTGNATVEFVETPEEIVFERTADGQDLYALSVPTLVVDASGVTGNPRLSYDISFPEQGLAIDEIQPIGGVEGSERVDIVVDQRTFQPHEIEGITEAEITVRLRGDSTRVLFEATIPVEGAP